LNTFIYVKNRPTLLDDPLGLNPGSGIIGGFTGGTTDALPPIPPEDVTWQMLEMENEKSSECSICRTRCIVNFANPVPGIGIEYGAGKAVEKIGSAAKEIAKDFAKKYNKINGAWDLSSCLDGCANKCKYEECVDKAFQNRDFCFTGCQDIFYDKK